MNYIIIYNKERLSMLRKWLTMLLIVTTAISSGANLIERGNALGRIFIPAHPELPVIFAVQELQKHLKAMTNVDILLAWRVANNSDSGFILTVRPESEWKGKESSQTFRITETTKPVPRVTISGNTSLAVLYGIYQYLSDQGIRWFEPGKSGTNIPRLASLKINERHVMYTPSFHYRCLDFSGWHDTIFDYSDPEKYQEKIHYEYDLWLLRNRLIFDRSIHNKHYFNFNHFAAPAGHSLRKKCKLYPKDFQKTPERFPLVTRNFKQERTASNAQICFTNELNFRNAVKSCLEHFRNLEKTKNFRNTDLDEIADVVDMSLEDCTGICECNECRKVSGSAPLWRDRLVWHFMNRIAMELNRKMPGKKIMLFAPYFELTKPPADVNIESNIIAIACRSLTWLNTPENTKSYPFVKNHKENIESTAKAGALMQAYDYFLWAETPQPLAILAAAKYYAEKGFKRYHAEVMSRNEMIWPLLWTLAQFTWDTSRDPYQLLDEFCMQYYGQKNGKLVLEILQKIDANSRTIHRIIYGGPADTSLMLPDSFINEYRPKLEQAVKHSTEKELERMRRFSDCLELQMRYAEIYRAYCHALNQRTPLQIRQFKEKTEKFYRFWFEKQMIRYCSPAIYKKIQNFRNVNFHKLLPQGRPLSLEQRIKELFSGTAVPAYQEIFWLPENWKFQLDIEDRGLKKNWHSSKFDDSKWPLISTWAMYENQGYTDVDGRFWYRTAVDIPKFTGDKVILRIGSLDDDGEVYVNGKLVYRGVDADMWDKSFGINVTNIIKQGARNVIAIRGYDATGGGGLWRHCAIYTLKK